MRITLAESCDMDSNVDQYYVFQNMVLSTSNMAEATTLEEWRYHADMWWISTLLYMSMLTRDF